MPIDCPKCGEPNPTSRRVCRVCSEQLKPNARDTRCPDCYHPAPAHRNYHWLSLDDPRSHISFQDNYLQQSVLGWIYEARKRYSGMADENGLPLSCAEAWKRKMELAQAELRGGFEEFHKAHVAQNDLKVRRDESRSAFHGRCAAAAGITLKEMKSMISADNEDLMDAL